MDTKDKLDLLFFKLRDILDARGTRYALSEDKRVIFFPSSLDISSIRKVMTEQCAIMEFRSHRLIEELRFNEVTTVEGSTGIFSDRMINTTEAICFKMNGTVVARVEPELFEY